MRSSEHRIQRITFAVDLPGTAMHRRFADMVQAQFDAVIAPAFEAALDRIDTPGAALRLDRVEVDLGALGAELPSPDEVRARLTDAISAALSAYTPGASAREGDAEELARLLEEGTLPWKDPGRVLGELTRRLMALDIMGIRDLAERLRTVLVRRRAAERLVRQLPAQLVARLYRALVSPGHAAAIAQAFGPDSPVPRAPFSPVAQVAVAVVSEGIRDAAMGVRVADLGEVFARFVAIESRDMTVARWVDMLPPEHNHVGAVSTAVRDERPVADVDRRSWPVHAAGGVLLHPFIGRWFDAVDLLDAPGRFRSFDARARAVLLIHHLVTGADDAPEPDTLVFKLLCGCPFVEPIPRSVELTDLERIEEATVLDALVRHWSRLGNASAQGVRDGFLLRPGQLMMDGGRWRLRVERRGIDVLLKYLPWSLSVVKTPFMDAPLTVDWL